MASSQQVGVSTGRGSASVAARHSISACILQLLQHSNISPIASAALQQFQRCMKTTERTASYQGKNAGPAVPLPKLDISQGPPQRKSTMADAARRSTRPSTCGCCCCCYCCSGEHRARHSVPLVPAHRPPARACGLVITLTLVLLLLLNLACRAQPRRPEGWQSAKPNQGAKRVEYEHPLMSGTQAPVGTDSGWPMPSEN